MIEPPTIGMGLGLPAVRLPVGACSGQSSPPNPPTPVPTTLAEVPVIPPDLVATGGVFLVQPYLQLGDNSALSNPERLALLWHADDRDDDWSVEVQVVTGGPWVAMPTPAWRRVAVPGRRPTASITRASRAWRRARSSAIGYSKGGTVDFYGQGEGPQGGRATIPVRRLRRLRRGDGRAAGDRLTGVPARAGLRGRSPATSSIRRGGSTSIARSSSRSTTPTRRRPPSVRR